MCWFMFIENYMANVCTHAYIHLHQLFTLASAIYSRSQHPISTCTYMYLYIFCRRYTIHYYTRTHAHTHSHSSIHFGCINKGRINNGRIWRRQYGYICQTCDESSLFISPSSYSQFQLIATCQFQISSLQPLPVHDSDPRNTILLLWQTLAILHPDTLKQEHIFSALQQSLVPTLSIMTTVCMLCVCAW